MPGPFINNDGYEPADWDTPKTEKPAPTYNGVGLNSGPVDLAPHVGEGFALLLCGGTAVKIGYTNMHLICGWLASGSQGYSFSKDVGDIRKAFEGVTCETSVGNTPMIPTYTESQLREAETKLARVKDLMAELSAVLKS
jgi:hypothetical protein